MNPYSLGILLVVLGFFFFLITRVLMRVVPRVQPASQSGNNLQGGTLLDQNPDAVLVVIPGGRLQSINEAGRQLFKLQVE
jgi:hypothetical protein